MHVWWQVKTSPHDTRSVKTNVACWSLDGGSQAVSATAIKGDVFCELLMAMISTRAVDELMTWLKGAGPPIDAVISSVSWSPATYVYVAESIVSEPGCCCGFGAKTTVMPASTQRQGTKTGYAIKDAILETLKLYLLAEKPGDAVLSWLALGERSRLNEFVQKAQTDAALKPHLLAVIWSVLPLNKSPFPEVPRKGNRPGPEPPRDPQANAMWSKLEALKVRYTVRIATNLCPKPKQGGDRFVCRPCTRVAGPCADGFDCCVMLQ